ncbi:MAG: MobA/MobL family protein [Cyanobacteria bacterium]|jgi:hypothetical protein|nr:MobA/MobL family protein [Cyanobacteria bacterium GSL.Bin21]
MSIYHQNLKHISRGKGQSACAAAAYRSASKIYDQRLGQTHNYEKKQGVDYTEILAPSYAPPWVNNRAQLWNQVEKKETRINARPASELDIALPIELSQQQQIKLIKTFAQTTLVSRSLIVDLACHDLDSHNPHAHLMFTTRKINEQGLGEKDRDIKSKDFLNSLRQTWEEQANDALAQAKIPERIDHRSLEAQGIVTRVPQIHLGPDICQMRARGMSTDRGGEYDEIEQTNANLAQLYQDLEQLDQQIQTEEQRQRQEEKKRQQEEAKQQREAEKKAQRAQAQKFNSLEELDPERDTRLKWDHLNLPDSQRLNQCIQIHHQFKQILNDKNFPIEVLKHDPEFNSPQSQMRFRITHNNQSEHWVVTKTDQDFYLTQLDDKGQDPQGLPKKLHLSLNNHQNPIVCEYNISLGEHHKLYKIIPDLLQERVDNYKVKHQARKRQEQEKARKQEQQQLNQLYRQIKQVHQQKAHSSRTLYLSESTNQQLRKIFSPDHPQTEYLIRQELAGYSIRELHPMGREVSPENPELAASEKLHLIPNNYHQPSLSQNQREDLLRINWQSHQEEERQRQERLHQQQEKERKRQAKRQQFRKPKPKKKKQQNDQDLQI